MRTRKTEYLNSYTLKPEYSFQVFDGEWKNVAENGRLCIYKTEEERDKKRAEYRKLKPTNALSSAAAVGGRLRRNVRRCKIQLHEINFFFYSS